LVSSVVDFVGIKRVEEFVQAVGVGVDGTIGAACVVIIVPIWGFFERWLAKVGRGTPQLVFIPREGVIRKVVFCGRHAVQHALARSMLPCQTCRPLAFVGLVVLGSAGDLMARWIDGDVGCRTIGCVVVDSYRLSAEHH
jgi:hypothetical protein